MYVNDLYDSILIEPLSNYDADKLFIVSGYASATFARRHLLDLLNINKKIEVNLIVGMPGAKSDHIAFVQLHKEFEGKFNGYYLNSSPPVHSKVYTWFSNKEPLVGYAGSANYSQYGFFAEQQVNQISDDDPIEIRKFYDSLLKRAIYMPDLKIEIPIGHRIDRIEGSVPAGEIEWEIPNKRVSISFLDKSGNLPGLSGLNWGQRKEKRINKLTGIISYVTREPNQAYLSLKQDARKEGFLPEHALNFTLITDDGESFDCVVAQQGRKAIESTKDNSLLGKYIRKRIKVPLGKFVKAEDLEKYGRTDYTIEKINDETFLLDFSVKPRVHLKK